MFINDLAPMSNSDAHSQLSSAASGTRRAADRHLDDVASDATASVVDFRHDDDSNVGGHADNGEDDDHGYVTNTNTTTTRMLLLMMIMTMTTMIMMTTINRRSRMNGQPRSMS
jgi:hypothetical protein